MTSVLLLVALAPALVGTVSIVLGLVVFRFLARAPGPPEEAAVRLFGLIFLALGITLINIGGAALIMRRARRRGASSSAPPVTPLALTTLAVIALDAPLHLWWQAPWQPFRHAVLVLDLIALILVCRLVVRVATYRRPSPRRPLSAPARARWRLFGVLFGVSGLMVGWLGSQQAVADWRGWSQLRSVSALVVRQHSFNLRDPDRGTISMGTVIVQYSVDGKGFETTIPLDPASPSFRRGARVDLFYHPTNPRSVRFATAYHTFFLGGVLLVTAISFLGIATASFVRAEFR